MAAKPPRSTPRHYFLNEVHELLPAAPDGGGRFQPALVDWRARSERLVSGFRQIVSAARMKRDPTRDTRFFMVALPDLELQVRSAARSAVGGAVKAPPSFLGEDGRTLQRLGLDVLHVERDGAAIVHAKAESIKHLSATALLLDELSERERKKWGAVGEVRVIERRHKVDEPFLQRLAQSPGEAVIVAHAVLTQLEGAKLGQLIKELAAKRGRTLLAEGRDYLGAHWFRLVVDRPFAEELADSFDSIHLIHPPIRSGLASPNIPSVPSVPHSTPSSAALLPIVALVDSGVVEDHPQLSSHVVRSVGRNVVGSHGTAVASRLVWGEMAEWPTAAAPVAGCSLIDVRVANSDETVDPQVVLDAMNAVDVARLARVFNISIAHPEPWGYPDDEPRLRDGLIRYTAMLDAFAFDKDALLVVAAGNTPIGVHGTPPYPRHVDDPLWGLTFWSCGVNTLVCGSFVADEQTNGLAPKGGPSPFSRIGPGVANASQPLFSATGGNWTQDWEPHDVDLGVGAASSVSWEWRRWSGTSFAAPIVARQAAMTLQAFQQYCPEGTRASAGLAKAFLVWSAHRPGLDGQLETLARRTLGRGTPSFERLRSALEQSALLFWQGRIPSEKSLVRVRFPVPQKWLDAAQAPRLRLVAAWNTPVNEAIRGTWACRKVAIQVRPTVEGLALKGRNVSVGALPLIDRTFDLDQLRAIVRDEEDADTCILTISYSALVDPLVITPPEQPLGVLVELYDDAELPVSPHDSIVEWETRVDLPMQQLARIELTTPVRVPVP